MERNSSIELLRIISIVLIVMMHVSALLDWDNASTSNKLILGALNSIGNIGVSCFVLISGYFGIKFKFHKFFSLFLLTTFYCTIVAFFRYGAQPMPIIKAILTVPSYSLWFVTCYLILMLLASYLNFLADTLPKEDYKRMLIVLIIVLSVVPTIFNGGFNGVVLRQGGKNLTYILFLYLLGRYIRLHYDKSFSRWCLLGGHILCSVLILALNILGTWLFHKRCVIFRLDCSPFILLSAVSVFYIFKSFTFYSRTINSIASSVFAFYLLSNIYHYFNDEFVHLTVYSDSYKFWLYLLLLVGMSWVVSLIIDKTLGRVLDGILVKSENKIKTIFSSNKLT